MTPSCTDLVHCSVFRAKESTISSGNNQVLFTATKNGIVMDYFPLTAEKGAPRKHDTLARRIKSIGVALDFLHENSIAHMDIKPANIFISQDGAWKLGDFDSACPFDKPIHSTTNGFHLTTTELDVATAQIDWGMLLCTLAFIMSRGEDGTHSPVILAHGANLGMYRGHMIASAREEILATATGELKTLIEEWRGKAGSK